MTIAMQSLMTDEDWAELEAEVDRELAEEKEKNNEH